MTFRKRSHGPSSLPKEERRLRSRLHQLLHSAGGFLHGSLIEMARRCGNPRCRCATDDANKHRSLYLGQTRKGKTSMTYIPKNQEQTVRRWAENFQQASALLETLNEQGRLRLDSAKQEARSAKVKASKAAAAKKKKATKKRARKKTSTTTRKRPS